MSDTAKYLPDPRDHSFEWICYFLEMGPAGMALIDLGVSYIIYSLLGLKLIYLPLIFILIPLLSVGYLLYSLISSANAESAKNWENKVKNYIPDWNNSKETGLIFNDKSLINKYRGRKIPMETAIELYFNDKIDFCKPTKEIMINRYNLFTMVFTWGHVKWFLFTFLGQLTGHTLQRDAREVGDVYNRGNDFYEYFLGKTMVYTSGIFRNPKYELSELEEAQHRKLDTIFQSIHLKKGENLLDIGCGWGTLVIRAADKWGANAFGCTLAKEQVEAAQLRIDDKDVYNLSDKKETKSRINWIINDYRKIPQEMATKYKAQNIRQFDKITCVEMAEHVGIKNFQPFLKQVHRMLKDDGMFYIQMCGVRRTWSFEDLVWILFMGKYVFPGADASTPINWVLNQLERSGFEIHRVENLGCHYARTIEMWHDNWVKNKSEVIKSYNVWWYRLWDIFLAWSFMIARQGTSSVYMMTVHKNLLNDQHSINTIKGKAPILNRTKQFIGPDVVAYQQ